MLATVALPDPVAASLPALQGFKGRVWSPNPGSQALFLTCPFGEALYEGTRGPGKTLALAMDYGKDVGVGHGPRWRGILFRRTYKQLADFVSKTRRFFAEVFPGATFNESEYTWRFKHGEELLLRYMDREKDYWNYHGHEYPWIGWEELTDWPDSSCYDIMKGCWRWPADTPSAEGVVQPGTRYRSTTNPYGKGHNWVKKRFIDPKPAGVPIREKDTVRVRIRGHWSENHRLLSANPEYITNIASDANPERRKAWVDGSWDIQAGGMVDDLWDRAFHVIQPFDIPTSWRIDRSMDWGSSKPFSIGWWAESDGTEATLKDGSKRSWPRGTLFQIAEWYGWNGNDNEGCKMLAAEVGRELARHEEDLVRGLAKHVRWIQPGPADSQIFDDTEGKSIASEFAKAGVTWTKADKSPGTRKLGAEAIRALLKAVLKRPMEEPGLMVFTTCVHAIRTNATISRSEKDPDDVDTDSEDHAWDMWRYRILKREDHPGEDKLPF